MSNESRPRSGFSPIASTLAAMRHNHERETVMDSKNRDLSMLWTATAAALGLAAVLAAPPATAAFLAGTNDDDLIFGTDDDNVDNPTIQPEDAVNQSLNDADAIDGKNGDDVLIGLLGSDTIRGGRGNDVIIGGTEQG